MSHSKTPKQFRTKARRYINRHFHIIFQRMVYVLLFATIQIAILVWLLVRMNALIPYFVILCAVISSLPQSMSSTKTAIPPSKSHG